MIVVSTPPATEPLTVSEVMAHLRIDSTSQEPAPGAITAALPVTLISGNVDNGTHRYLATFVTASGETQAGIVSSAVTIVDKTVNGKVELTNIPIGGALVISRNIYRTAAGGSIYLFLATISNNTATIYTDNIADSSLGIGAPAANTTDDPVINMLITSARQAAELELHRSLITQTQDLYLDYFPGQDPRWWEIRERKVFYWNEYEIILPPIQSVTSITYYDINGVLQTLAADQYAVDNKSMPSRIVPAYGLSWPSARPQNNAITIRFVSGYGSSADVPKCIKNWMLMRISAAWEYRGPLVAGERGFNELPTSFYDGLLDPERISARI